MIRSYWRIVIRPNLGNILFLGIVSFLAGVAEVVSIGLVIPVVAVFSGAESQGGRKFLSILESVARSVDPAPDHSKLLILALAGIGLCVILKSALALGASYLSAVVSQDTSRKLTLQMFTAYANARYSELIRRERGEILQDIKGPSDSMGHVAYYSGLSMAAIGQVALTLMLLLWLSPWLTLVMGAIGIVLAYVNRRYLREHVAKLGQADYPLQQAGAGLLVNAIDGMRVVKVYNLADRLRGRLDHFLGSRMHIAVRQLLFQQLPKISFEFIGMFVVVVLIALAQMVPSLGLDFPVLAAFVVALRQITPTYSTLNVNFLNMAQHWSQAQVIEDTLTRMPQEDAQRGTAPVPDIIQAIRLEAVSFAYEKNARLPVLRDLSLAFARGRVTALVGATGAGKTTIVDLLLRFQEPHGGRILANDTDIRQFTLEEWRRKIGYVGQDVFLFNATLGENIAALDGGVAPTEIVRAAKLAQIHEDISRLPERYDAPVGDRGVRLSGGQRQRIAVARALLKRPQILILDEATSELDNLTERALHDAIDFMRREAIVILIAHRLHTVEDADEILVLQEGRVTERGAHATLLAQRGLYWQLHNTTQDPSPVLDEPVQAPKGRA